MRRLGLAWCLVKVSAVLVESQELGDYPELTLRCCWQYCGFLPRIPTSETELILWLDLAIFYIRMIKENVTKNTLDDGQSTSPSAADLAEGSRHDLLLIVGNDDGQGPLLTNQRSVFRESTNQISPDSHRKCSCS